MTVIYETFCRFQKLTGGEYRGNTCVMCRVRGAILGRRANGRKGETILAEFGEIADDRR